MKSEDVKALLSKGFYPEALPKTFSSESFGEQYDNFRTTITREKETTPYKYDAPKDRYSTRQFTILNPHSYAKLVDALHNNWADINTVAAKSSLSQTKINFADATSRAIKGYGKAKFQNDMFCGAVAKNVLLITDVKNFYPSIYTHSIAWAVHDKKYIKKLYRDGKKSEADALGGSQLDKLTRRADENQTNGIPIGPDTSRILADLILAAIDHEFVQSLNKQKIEWSGGRYYDDYNLYFETEEDAMSALALLRKCLNEYRLAINEGKTHTLTAPPIPIEESWKRSLRNLAPWPILKATSFYSVSKEEVPFTQIRQLIEAGIASYRKTNNERVMNFLVGTLLRRYICDPEDWDSYEAYLLQLLIHFPGVTKAVIDIYEHHLVWDDKNINKVLNTLLEKPALNTYSALWLLYLAISLKLKISDKASENIVTLENPLLLLMLRHAVSIKLASVEEKVFFDKWLEFELYDEGWLYKYEMVRHGWIKDTVVIAGDPFFKSLLDCGVMFYVTDEDKIKLEEDDWHEAVDLTEVDVIDWYE